MNKILSVISLSLFIPVCMGAMNHKENQYGKSISLSCSAEEAALWEERLKKLSDICSFVTPRSKEKTDHMKMNQIQDEELQGLIRSNRTIRKRSNIIERNFELKIFQENIKKEIDGFVAIEESSRRKPVFNPRKADTPIYDKFMFDQAVNERNADIVINLINDNEELRDNYYPAQFLDGIYSHFMIDGFHVNRSRIEPVIIFDAFEDIALRLAHIGGNVAFLEACEEHPRLKEELKKLSRK